MLDNNRMSLSEIMELARSVDARMEDNPEGNPEGYDEAGDAGKRAIDRMKAERNEHKTSATAAKAEKDRINAEFEAYKAANPVATAAKKDEPNSDGKVTNEGKSAEQVEKDLIARYSQGLLRSTVREIAGSTLADANDALVLGNWTDMTPNEFGEYDRSAITEKINELTKNKPYLLKSTKKFEGAAEGGNQGQGANNETSQLSREDLKTMNPTQINEARAKGRLRDILSGK